MLTSSSHSFNSFQSGLQRTRFNFLISFTDLTVPGFVAGVLKRKARVAAITKANKDNKSKFFFILNLFSQKSYEKFKMTVRENEWNDSYFDSSSIIFSNTFSYSEFWVFISPAIFFNAASACKNLFLSE